MSPGQAVLKARFVQRIEGCVFEAQRPEDMFFQVVAKRDTSVQSGYLI